MQLSPDQQKATEVFLDFLLHPTANEMVIAGHSGTGKTFLTKHLIKATQELNAVQSLLGQSGQIHIEFTATTNKAASVLSERIGSATSTIHSLLNLRVKNNFSTGKTTLTKTRDFVVKQNMLIIIDEASMCDSNLLKIIREATLNCKILFIGDPYQLAPVFESDCPVFSTTQDLPFKTTLTTIQRQAAGNSIITLGDTLRKAVSGGPFPDLTVQTSHTDWLTGPEFQHVLTQAFAKDEPSTSKILAWTNARVTEYNGFVRGLHTTSPTYTIGEELITNNPIMDDGSIAYPTDALVTVTDIREGEHSGLQGHFIRLGSVETFMPSDSYALKYALKMHSASKDWSSYFALKEECADLRPIHASTVHKSQGSTYDYVFIDLGDIGRNNIRGEVARMLYVAITRAAKNVYLYGQLPAKYME